MSTPRVDALAKELSPMIDTMTAENAFEYIRVSMNAFCALASQLETELAAMTTERDSAFALLKTERDAFADMLAQRDAEREKVWKMRNAMDKIEGIAETNRPSSEEDQITMNCIVEIASEALEATK